MATRVFVSEFLCSGGCPAMWLESSLAAEGRAMLEAVVADFARAPGVRVVTTWDARLGPPPVRDAEIVLVENDAEEPRHFARLAADCDATLVIAPETDGVLAQRCRVVERAGRRLLGPGSDAVELCGDKLRLARYLIDRGINTPPTVELDPAIAGALVRDGTAPEASDLSFPLVIKPRHGAGSQSTCSVNDPGALSRLLPALAAELPQSSAIAQSLVAGRAVSVGLLVSPRGDCLDAFPPAEQTLSADGHFHYRGGVIPARGVDSAAVCAAACAACRAVPGLRGYVGVDLVARSEAPREPVVIEINPRLTTSYLGYRRLTDENLAARMLADTESRAAIPWNCGPVRFDAAGGPGLS